MGWERENVSRSGEKENVGGSVGKFGMNVWGEGEGVDFEEE